MGPVGWGAQGGGWYPSGPPPLVGLGSQGLSDATIYAFTAALQGVVAEGVTAALPSHYLAAPAGMDATLLLLHLRFTCRVAGDGDLSPIWEAVARGKINMEGLETLKQTLMRGLPSCIQVFGGGEGGGVALQSLPPPPITGQERVTVEPLLRPSLLWEGVHSVSDTPGGGLGVHPWGVDTSLLAQKFDR